MLETKKFVEWETPEFVHRPKSANWYWTLALVATAGFLAALLTKNFLFAIFILVAAGVLYLLARRRPETVRVAITERGLLVADNLLPYREARSFCFRDRHGHTHLSIATERWLARGVTVPLHPEHTPATLRPHLEPYLDEVEEAETLADALIHRLGL